MARRDRFREALLGWFRVHRRPLPWRSPRGGDSEGASPDPYRVWVSEVMLQQTVVAAVVPRFERWMKRFPDLDALAASAEREVLREWEGLGYYSRARNLHAAARIVRDRHASRIPDEYDALRRLPGIGDYTANAILSIAFRRARVLIDANVRRIGMRLFAIAEPGTGTDAVIRDFLERRIPRDSGSMRGSNRGSRQASEPPPSPGDFNEALMELGELVCRPRNPDCANCPVRGHCLARERGLADSIPGRRKVERLRKSSAVAFFEHRGRIFVEAPPKGGRFAGLYAFPKAELGGSPGTERELDVVATIARNRLFRGLRPVRYTPLPARAHSYTRYIEELRPVLVRLEGRRARAGSSLGLWVDGADLAALPLPSIYRRIVRDMELQLAGESLE